MPEGGEAGGGDGGEGVRHVGRQRGVGQEAFEHVQRQRARPVLSVGVVPLRRRSLSVIKCDDYIM